MYHLYDMSTKCSGVCAILQTSEPLWQLETCNIYILDSVSQETKSKIEDLQSQAEFVHETDTTIERYNVLQIDEPISVNFDKEIESLLNSGEFEYIIPLSLWTNDKYYYLLGNLSVKSDGSCDITQALSNIRQFYKANAYDFALDNLSNPTFAKGILHTIGRRLKSATSFFGYKAGIMPSFGLPLGAIASVIINKKSKKAKRPPKSDYSEECDFAATSEFIEHEGLHRHVDEDLDVSINEDENYSISNYAQDNEILANISDLVQRAVKLKDKLAEEKLHYIFKRIPYEYFVEVFKRMTPAQLEKSSKVLDPSFLATQSPMRIEIRESDPKQRDKRKKTDGEYLIFLTKGQETEQVRFPLKAHFIVYLIYLLDRYKHGDQVDAIDLYDQEKLYKSLYHEVYPKDDKCDKSYFNLVSAYNREGKERQSKIQECLSQIRFSVSNACLRLNEPPMLHFIPKADMHIRTLQSNISMPYKLIVVSEF